MSTLFVSDVHLDASLPAAGVQFIEFLTGIAAQAEALYILGDLFETWIGDDDAEPHRVIICRALAALARHGVPCHVMHGNRDFLLQRGFETASGCRLLADPTVIDLYGRSVLLTHGDALCIGDGAYQRLRGLVRNPRWQRPFLRLPLHVRRLLAQQARAGSTQHTGQTAAEIMDADSGAVRATLRACTVDTMIHGHTHRPAIHELDLDGRPARRIVLGAWYEQGSYLVATRDAFQLRTLPRDGSPAADVTVPAVPAAAAPAGIVRSRLRHLPDTRTSVR